MPKSIDHELAQAAINGQDVTQEVIKMWLQRDIRFAYLLLAEILANNDCLEALSGVYHKRYKEVEAQKVKQPALPL